MILISNFSSGGTIDTIKKKYSFNKTILLTSKELEEKAKKYDSKAEIKIINPFSKNTIKEICTQIFNEIKKTKEEVIINITEGTNSMAAAATVAAYYTGVKAINVNNKEIIELQTPPNSYEDYLTKKTTILLKKIQEKTKTTGVIEQSGLTSNPRRISRQLKSLETAGLIERNKEGTKKEIRLTIAGKLYVEMS